MKFSINSKKVLFILCLCSTSLFFAQEKPYRIGVKIGFPNIIGANVEYVTPLLQNKLSIFLDYSGIKADSFIDNENETTGKIKYFEAGLNYYFIKEGKGLYGGLSYGNLKVTGNQVDVHSETSSREDGTGVLDTSIGNLNIKIGGKFGGSFYFRPELGFAFSGFPKTIDSKVTFPDGSSEIQSLIEDGDIPSILTSGLMINLGFGFSF